MPDKQDQKKKDGARADKKMERMRTDVRERKTQTKATVAGDPHQRDPNETNRSGTKS
jgi:hypothetical protein